MEMLLLVCNAFIIPTEGSMQDNTVARLQNSRVQTPLLLNIMYCVIVSLRTVKNPLRNVKEKGVLGNLYLSLMGGMVVHMPQ